MAKRRTQRTASLDHIHEALRFLAVPIESLVPDPDNTKKHSDASLQGIAESLRQYGQDQPLIVQKSGRIVRKGNGRLQAAKNLGWTHIAAAILDDDELTAIGRSIADNRSAEFSAWNLGKLVESLRRIEKEKQLNLQAVGFSQRRIADLEARFHRLTSNTQAAPEAETNGTKFVVLFFDDDAIEEFQKLSNDLRVKWGLASVQEVISQVLKKAVEKKPE